MTQKCVRMRLRLLPSMEELLTSHDAPQIPYSRLVRGHPSPPHSIQCFLQLDSHMVHGASPLLQFRAGCTVMTDADVYVCRIFPIKARINILPINFFLVDLRFRLGWLSNSNQN